MRDIGQRINQLLLAQGTSRPIGKARRFVDLRLGQLAHDGFIAHLVAEAADHRGNLRVEDGMRHGAREMHHDFHILPRRVKNFQHLFVVHQGKERLEVDSFGHRINQAIDLRPGDLNEAEIRPIGRFAHEFRVNGHKRLMRQGLAQRCQRLCIGNKVHEG